MTFGGGVATTFAESWAVDNKLPESEMGPEEAGAREVFAEDAGEDEAGDVFAWTVTGAANTAGTVKVICFDEAVLARRRFGRFLPTALASTQRKIVTAMMVTTIITGFFRINLGSPEIPSRG